MSDQDTIINSSEISPKINLRYSIVTRFAFFFTILLVSVILIVGWFLYKESAKAIVDFANERLEQGAKIAERSFFDQIDNFKEDCFAVRSMALQTGLLVKHDISDKNQFKNEMLTAFLNIKQLKGLHFIRKTGEVVLDLEDIESPLSSTNTSGLIGKFDPFIQEALVYENLEFHLSEIEWKDEYEGQSIIRIAMPITASNESWGILVADFSMEEFFKRIEDLNTGETNVLLVDSRGQYVFAKEKINEIEITKGRNQLFKDDFKLNTNNLNLSGQSLNKFLDKNDVPYLNYIQSLTYSNGRRKLYLLMVSKQENVLLPARNIRAQSLRIVLLFCFLTLIPVYFFARYFSKKIGAVTSAITDYESGKKATLANLEIERNEIGLLASSFQKMQLTIDRTIAKLQTSLAEEQKAKLEKDEFLQNMSHEMRTPLHAILGLTSMLKRNKPRPEQNPIISSLERSTKNLSGLVYDVLDYRKLSQGELSLNYEAVNLGQLLKDVFDNYYYEGFAKGLKLDLQINKLVSESDFLTDGLRLTQIITNIYINAIKYTNQGFVNLTADIIDNQLEVIIADSGIGINEENLEKLNERYFREGNQITGRYGDYGLGLAIVKQLLGLFGGNLMVHSQKNVGSKFILRIPVSKIKEDKIESETSLGSQSYPRSINQNILHIEDDQISRELVKYTVEDHPFHLTQCNSYSDLETHLSNGNYDIIVTDIQIGTINLLESKVWPILNSKKLIIASGYDFIDATFPIEFVLTKPYRAEDLLDLVYTSAGVSTFGRPDWKNLYANYDGKKDLVSRVLGLIANEVATYIQELEILAKQFDLKNWQQIKHKLITHARDFKLDAMIDLLQVEETKVSTEAIYKLLDALKNLACWIRIERRLNSEG